jgi:hypothetical protein
VAAGGVPYTLFADVAQNQSHALDALPVETDPELIALPSPPKQGRGLTVAVMALTTLAAAVLAWSLRSEAGYATKPGAPLEIGDLAKAQLGPELENRYVRGSALLGSHGAIRYGRAAEGDSFRLAPVLGQDKLWVEIHVPEGFEGPRFIPPSSFAGRLVPLSDAGLRHQSLRGAVADKTGTTIPPDAWVLIDSSSPRASRWALAMVVILLGFAAWNVVSIVRLLSRVKDDGARPAQPDGGPTAE